MGYKHAISCNMDDKYKSYAHVINPKHCKLEVLLPIWIRFLSDININMTEKES